MLKAERIYKINTYDNIFRNFINNTYLIYNHSKIGQFNGARGFILHYYPDYLFLSNIAFIVIAKRLSALVHAIDISNDCDVLSWMQNSKCFFDFRC